MQGAESGRSAGGLPRPQEDQALLLAVAWLLASTKLTCDLKGTPVQSMVVNTMKTPFQSWRLSSVQELPGCLRSLLRLHPPRFLPRPKGASAR